MTDGAFIAMVAPAPRLRTERDREAMALICTETRVTTNRAMEIWDRLCALSEIEPLHPTPPQGSGETLETLIYPTRHRSAFSVEVVVATEAQAHALRDALTAASAQSAGDGRLCKQCGENVGDGDIDGCRDPNCPEAK